VRRASVNYWVDFLTAAAFVVCAVSGILFLFPSDWWTSGMLGLSAATWHTLHDWSGVLMTAGVAAHLVLHWRWLWKMTQREFSDEPASRRAAVSAGAAVAPMSGAGAPDKATRPGGSDPRGPDRFSSATRSARGREIQRLYDRRDFLGAALAAGVVAVAGVGLLARDSSATASTTTQTADASDGSSSSSSTGGTSSGDAGTSSGQSQDSTSDAAARVVVDSSQCVGCGHCLGVCPAAVFAWGGDGRTATAADPQACQLCRRCLQVCAPQAITLNA
jgi:NAD-dependent dihydropyrimidine dehydrogenase PreA subunit